MSSTQGIIQIGPTQWKGARLIEIDALPDSLPSGLQEEVLARCLYENVSVELCLSTAAAPTQLTILLILRAGSPYQYDALERLDRVEKMVEQLLSRVNVRCGQAKEYGWLGRFFGGDLSGISAGIGFFPPEGGPNMQGYYLPGSYDDLAMSPVNLGRMAEVMAAYPDSFLSIQLNAASLMPGELALIQNTRIWFAARPNDPLAKSWAEAFGEREQLGSRPQFFINFFCLGSENCVRDLAAQAKLYHMSAYRLPENPATCAGYAIRGDEWATRQAVAQGHDPHCLARVPGLLRRVTHMATLESAVSALPLPRGLTEIKGIRRNLTADSTEPLPAALSQSGGVFLGRHGESGQSVYISEKSLTRHGFFVGKPGSGKTVFALGFLRALAKREKPVPFLAIEPAKREYRSLIDCVPGLRVYTPGRQDLAPLQLNPFLPPRGVTLEQYRPSLEAIFSMAVAMTHPLDIIFPQVISRCYARYGWRPDSTSETPGARVFGMHEFIREFREYTRESYASDPEARNNIENGGVVRLMAIMNNPLFDTNQSVDVWELLKHPTVIELDALDNASHKALVMGILLTQVMLAFRHMGDANSTLRNLILIDEAHLLLSQNETAQQGSPAPSSAVVGMLQNMTLILRSYGVALIFGDQSPARLTGTILGNVNLKMMFRLDSQRDRSILADTARLNDAMVESMVSLPTGQAYMMCDGMSAPTRVIVPNWEEELKLDKSIPDSRIRELMKAGMEPPFYQCGKCGKCASCDMAIRSNAQFIAGRLMDEKDMREALMGTGDQREIVSFVHKAMDETARRLMERFQIPCGDEPRFLGCVRAQLIRALLLSPQCRLTEEELLAPPAPDSRDQAPREKKLRLRASPGDAQDEKSALLDYIRNNPGR